MILVLIGNGGHARSCRDIAVGQLEPLYFLADNDDGDHRRLGGFDEVGRIPDARFHLAIGPSQARTQLARKLIALDTKWFSLVSPRAINRSKHIGEGAFIGHRAYVGPAVRIGDNSIINTGSIIEHDCEIGEGAFIGPGAVLCGAVKVGTYAMIGAGAIVMPKMEIAAEARIPAGAVVR